MSRVSRKSSFPSWVMGGLIAVVGAAGVAAGLTMILQDKAMSVDVSAPPPRTPSTTPAPAPAPAPSVTGVGAAVAGSALTPAGPLAASAGSATRASGSTPTSAAGTRAPATTVTTRPPTSTASTTPAAAVMSPATAGTYRYRQAGSLAGTPAEGTLVVAPASSSGSQTWTRMVGGTVAPSSTAMLFDSNGAFMVAPGAAAVGGPQTCSFATPVPWPPWPITVGRTTSAHATCAGTISSYDVTSHVQGFAALPLDGRTVNTTIVVNTIVIAGSANGSPLHVTLTETDYYAAGLWVPVVTKTHMAGSVMGLSVTTDRTDTLESARPS